MPLKYSTKINMDYHDVEEVGWAIGQIQYRSYMNDGWNRRLFPEEI